MTHIQHVKLCTAKGIHTEQHRSACKQTFQETQAQLEECLRLATTVIDLATVLASKDVYI